MNPFDSVQRVKPPSACSLLWLFCRPQSAICPVAIAFLLAAMPPRPILAQGTGVAAGKLVNGTDPRIVAANVELDVIRLGGGMSVLKSALTDSSGRFRIEGLPTDSRLLIRANYKSVNYHGKPNFDSSGKAYVEIEVFETTTSMKGIRMEGIRLGFQLGGEHLSGLETCSLVNETRPKRTFMSPEGSFRFTKASGIETPPRLSVTGPGAEMPLVQSPLESSDGQSYYSLYPLRPGATTFEVEHTLPYHNRTYTYNKTFYQDVATYQIGVIPQDMTVTGEGLQRIQVDREKNFAIYSGGPVKAGMQVVWTFNGGTPLPAAPSSESAGESRVKPVPAEIGQRALLIGSLLLLVFIVVLWYAYNHAPARPEKAQDPRIKELKERRERLLTLVATLDHRYESRALDRREYLRRRDQAKRQLRRIAALLGRK